MTEEPEQKLRDPEAVIVGVAPVPAVTTIAFDGPDSQPLTIAVVVYVPPWLTV